MNIRNGPISTAGQQLCRLCLGKEEELLDIFGVQLGTGQDVPLPLRIQGCLQLDITQHDSLPKWICKRCLEKIDDFSSFRERCRLNERKLLHGGDDGPDVNLLTVDDGDADAHTDDDGEDDEEEEEELEMIVIDPSQDYESSNDSLPTEAYGEKSVNNSNPPIPPITLSLQQLNQTAEEEDPEGSDAEEGEEEEEEEDEGEIKCDTGAGGEGRNGLPSGNPDSGNTATKVQKTVVYTCKYCDVAFAAASACQLHEMQDHDLLAPYGCTYCEYKTSIRTYLITHIRDSHSLARPYICVQCNKGFLRRSDLKKHTFVHTGIRPYGCDQCSKSFSRNTNLKKHMRTHLGLKPHSCQICARSFANKADLIRHRSYHRGQEVQHSCVRCGALYTQKDKLYEHERYCMGQTAFSFGLGVPPLVESVKQELPFMGSLGASIPLQEGVPPMEPNPAESIINDQPNYNPDAFSLSASNIPQTTPPSSKIYSCSKCPKRFLSKESLRGHQSIHPAEEKRIYECSQCKSQFDSKREYEQHLQTHPELKPFACATCGKRFSRRDKLNRHERTHQQDRNFSCPNCSAKFARKDAFESHLKIHCNPTVDSSLATGLLSSMAHVPGVQELMVPMPLQQHSLLYSMVREDGTMAIDPSMRM
ncbi:zinc finger protein 431-like [Anopheles maculipalpis]|uniref:zinc finger protein 431-like n=1 Tax=Anopheles maculipalpis TaxID=1496333 RepID=UPI0021595FE9|nr:zinc finger protein 431-like [Anopheles maculipalpis]